LLPLLLPRLPPEGKEKTVVAVALLPQREAIEVNLIFFPSLISGMVIRSCLMLLCYEIPEVRSTAEILRCNSMLMQACCSLQKQGLPDFRSDFCYF